MSPTLTELVQVNTRAGIAAAFSFLSTRARLFPQEPQVTLTVASRYTLLDKLGEGTMGVVFAAFDAQLGRKVALKFVRTRSHERANARLLREAHNLAQLSDPHVVQVYDCGEYREEVYLAMELIEGAPLAAWLQAERPKLHAILDVLIAAGRGLAAAHAKGIVHRDVKPANILVARDGRARMADFGLAFSEDGDLSTRSVTEEDGRTPRTSATTSLSGAGTPAYMSPEQFARGPIDARTDLFSYCVVMWEAVFGLRPFWGETNEALERAVREGRISPLPTRVRGARGKLEKVLRRGLATTPGRRHANMTALLAELTAIRERPRWLPMWMAGIAGALLMMLLGLLWAAPERCINLGRELGAQWTDDYAQELVAALPALEPGAAELLVRRVREFAEQLRDAKIGMCELHADGGLTDVQYQRAQVCLEERERTLEIAVKSLPAAAPGIVLTTPDDVTGVLGSVARCKQMSYLSTEVESMTGREAMEIGPVEALHEQGRSALLRGDFTGAAMSLAAAATEARTIGYAPRTAEVLYDLGRTLLRLRRGKEAREVLREARSLADGARDFDQAADAALLLFDASIMSNELEAAEWDYQEARSRLKQAKRDHGGALGELELARVNLRVRQGRFDEASRLLGEARALLGERPSEGGLWRFNALQAEATLAEQRGDLAAAVAAAEQAREELRKWVGTDDHPLAVETLGKLQTRGDEWSDAEASLARARQIYATSFGEDSPHVASVDVALARLYDGEGRQADAARVISRAAALLKALRVDEPMTLDDRVAVAGFLGRYLADEGQYAGALEVLGDGLTALEKTAVPVHDRSYASLAAQAADLLLTLGGAMNIVRADDRMAAALSRFSPAEYADDPGRASYVLRVAADVALKNEREGEALRYAAAARELLQAEPDAETSARLDFIVAKALGPREPQGRVLADRARDYFRVAGREDGVKEVDAWIGTIGGDRSRP